MGTLSVVVARKKHMLKVKENTMKKMFEPNRTNKTSKTGLNQYTLCGICNTTFATKSSLARHIKRSHNNNISEIAEPSNIQKTYHVLNSIMRPKTPQNAPKQQLNIICEYCEMTFTRTSGRSKHEKICSKKELNNKNNELKEKDNKIKQLEEHLEMMADDRRKFAELAITNAKNNSKAMSALNYVIYTYNNTEAKPLAQLKNTEANAILYKNKPKDISIEDKFIDCYRHNDLDKYIADCIITAYQCDDKSKQQFHSSDVSRLTYIVRELINKTNEWIADKKGVKIEERVIIPLLDNIKNIMNDYIKNLDDDDNADLKIICQRNQAIMDIMTLCEDVKFANRINKLVAPYFQVNTKPDIQEIS